MEFDIQKERLRINQILSKFTANYTSPISLSKHSTNKLKKHKKLYNSDIEFLKESDSLHFTNLFPKPAPPTMPKLPTARNSFPHIFTFQTLREALAKNSVPKDIFTNSSVASQILPKPKLSTKLIPLGNLDSEKTYRFLHPLREDDKNFYFNLKGDLKNSERTNVTKSLDRNYHEVRSFEAYGREKRKCGALEDGEILSVKAGKYFDKATLLRRKAENSKLGKSRVLRVYLPQGGRNMSRLNSKRRAAEDETPIRGWDKVTPLGINDD